MKCPKCGSKNEKDSLFCEECGAKLEGKEIKNKPKKNKKKLLIVLFLLVFLVCIGYFGYLYLNKDDYVEVGNYIGYTSDNALSEISNLGLKKKIEYIEVDNSYEYGVVVEQDLKDTKVKVGSTIKLGIGVSKDKVEVPDLTGMSLEEATEELENLGLVISSSEEESDETEEGHIISQSVDEGTSINVGSVIEVVVSSGSKEKEEEENESSSSNSSSSSSKSSSSSNSSSSSSSSSSASSVDYYFSSAWDSKTLVRAPSSSMTDGYGFTIVNDPGNLTITCSVDKTKYANVKSVNSGTTHTCYLQPLISTNSLILIATIDGTNITSKINFCIVGYLTGDTNCDGAVDSTDVSTVTKWAKVGPTNYSVYLYVADFDGDGNVTSSDADYIKNNCLGKSSC